jgi:hypothetical protein
MRNPLLPVIPLLVMQLAAQAPIQVAQSLPPQLDLRQGDAAILVPKDARDPAQVEAARRAWLPLIAGVKNEPSLRLLLPANASRLPMLLAASQALKAQSPAQRLYLAFDPQAPALWDESAWGAVDGGIVAPEDLGNDPATWRDLLVKAQEQLPGRPWFLWVPMDPGARASLLLGDGGNLAVPADGPAAKLTASVPAGFTDVEGGLGDLTLRNPVTGEARRWLFQNGAWIAAELPKNRHEVSVVATALYDVHGLLAKMRATQLRDRAAIQSESAQFDVELHLQSERGTGTDIGATFRSFEKAGEPQEMLQKEIRFNRVKANLKGEVPLPVIEPRAALAPPVALELTERYHYSDGGPAGKGQRLIRFEPVDQDPLLFSGELLVDEATGRILEERGSRSNLPGVVKSEQRTLSYGELAPGLWGLLRVSAYERWVTPGGVAQVQRRLTYSDIQINAPDFDAARQQARDSDATMLKQTVDGVRNYLHQADGTRQVETQPRASGKGFGGVLVVDSRMAASLPVLPAAGFAYFNFNALNRGIQVNLLTAVVYNNLSVMVPNLPGRFDLSMNASAMLWPIPERPVVNGVLSDYDAVDRSFLSTNLTLGRDLGAGFRLEGSGLFTYNRFQQTKDTEHETPYFTPPPSGWQQGWQGTLRWQFRGLQVKGLYGGGHRPEGVYGAFWNPQVIPDEGQFRYWGGSLGFDHQIPGGWILHGEAGRIAGRGFDRFLQVGGDAHVEGVNTAALPSDRTDYEKVAIGLPANPIVRLTFALDHGSLRAIDNHRTYQFTGMGVSGDFPGFYKFTTVRVNLGVGLQSDIAGLKGVQGYIALLRVF